MFQIARVAVDKATWHYDKLYDYYLPVVRIIGNV